MSTSVIGGKNTNPIGVPITLLHYIETSSAALDYDDTNYIISRRIQMKSYIPMAAQSINLPALLFVIVWLVSGCSASSESVASDTQSPTESSTSASDSDNPISTSDSNANAEESELLDGTDEIVVGSSNEEIISDSDSAIHTINTSGNEEDTEYSDEIVVESSIEPVVSNTYALNEVAQDLLLSLAGYQADQLAPIVDELAAIATDGLEGESMRSTEITIVDVQSETSVTEPVTRVSYNCASGGTITREKGSATFVNANILRSQRLNAYVFDQCNYVSSGITLPDDSYTINGSLSIVERQFSTSGYASIAYAYTWTGFNLKASSAASYELDGKVTTSSTTSSSGNSSSRSSEINLYRKTQADEVVVSIEDGVFKLNRSSNAGGSIQNYDVDIDGTIASLYTSWQTVEITTDPILSRQRGVGFSVDSNIPFFGQVEFLSEDGSFLYLTGNPTSVSSTNELDSFTDHVTLNLIDLVYTSVTGEQIENAGVALNPFTVVAPNCVIVPNETTDSIECDGDESLVLP